MWHDTQDVINATIITKFNFAKTSWRQIYKNGRKKSSNDTLMAKEPNKAKLSENWLFINLLFHLFFWFFPRLFLWWHFFFVLFFNSFSRAFFFPIYSYSDDDALNRWTKSRRSRSRSKKNESHTRQHRKYISHTIVIFSCCLRRNKKLFQ